MKYIKNNQPLRGVDVSVFNWGLFGCYFGPSMYLLQEYNEIAGIISTFPILQCCDSYSLIDYAFVQLSFFDPFICSLEELNEIKDMQSRFSIL